MSVGDDDEFGLIFEIVTVNAAPIDRIDNVPPVFFKVSCGAYGRLARVIRALEILPPSKWIILVTCEKEILLHSCPHLMLHTWL